MPEHLSQHIDYITPGIMTSAPTRKSKVKRNLRNTNRSSMRPRTDDHSKQAPNISATSTATCDKWITPACIKALYGIPDAQYNQPENTLGIFEFLDPYDQADLDLYFTNYAPWVPSGTHPSLVSINNATATAPQNDSSMAGESIMDIAVTSSLLYPQSISLYQAQATSQELKSWLKAYGATVANGLQMVDSLLYAIDGAFCTDEERKSGMDCGTVELPRVLSVSYGLSELQLPERVAKRACAEYMKLALMGHTIVVSSGDYGPAGHHPEDILTNGCINPKHLYNTDVNGTVFSPQFPTSCPYVLSVGATQLDRHKSVIDAESSMFIHEQTTNPDVFTFTSSGGRSNYFSTPKYQECTVNFYFKDHDPGYPTSTTLGKNRSERTAGSMLALVALSRMCRRTERIFQCS